MGCHFNILKVFSDIAYCMHVCKMPLYYATVKEIEACRETQINVIDIYNKLCTTIINEMNNTIPKLETKSAK